MSLVTTTVSIVNTAPEDLWLSATIASEQDWGSTVNPRDVNLGRGITSTSTLAAFGTLTATEDILSTATSARYTVTVSFQAPSDTGRTAVAPISFEVDQTEARSGAAAEASTRNLDVQDDPTGTWAVSQVGESPSPSAGVVMRGLTLYLMTPHES
jgi:hypothetical protein